MVGKRQLICNINNIAAYAVLNDGTYILGWWPTRSRVVERISFVSWEAQGNAGWYLETVRKRVDPAFHAWVIVQGVPVEVAEFRRILFQGRATERCGDVIFHQSSAFENYQVLDALSE